MSAMFVLTYDDGEKSAVVSWSEEYGWFMAGDRTVLGYIQVEERERRAPVVAVPDVKAVAAPVAPPVVELLDGGACYSCGCSQDAHTDGGCKAHGCRTYVP